MLQINKKSITDYFSQSYENLNEEHSLDQLSSILYENSFQKQRADLYYSDDSLTSLNWLNNISIAFSLSPNHTVNELSQPRTISNYHEGDKYISNVKSCSDLQNFPSKLKYALRSEGLFDPIIRHEYKISWNSKPPFSYTTLICMAMLELNKPKIALYEIYEWIRDNFLFYRISDSSWQNSVRHNLSLKKCFEKVPRRKDERGKGGFWRINVNYTDNLGSNIIKYRRQFQSYGSPKSSLSQGPGHPSWKERTTSESSSKTSSQITDDPASFPKRYSTPSVSSRGLIPFKRLSSSQSKSIFKKPFTLSSLNQYKTFEESDKVVSQMRLCDPPGFHFPNLYQSLADGFIFSDMHLPLDSFYSRFVLDDFDSTTSSSFDTDFSPDSAILQTSSSSDGSYNLPYSLDFDEFFPNL